MAARKSKLESLTADQIEKITAAASRKKSAAYYIKAG